MNWILALWPMEPAACTRPFSTEGDGLHYLWRGSGLGEKATTMGVYNPKNESWTLQQTVGSIPLGMYYGSCATLGNRLYSFGGYNKSSLFNNLNQLSLKTFQWSQIQPKNDPSSTECPIRKVGCGLVAVDDETLGCFGGYGTDPTKVLSGSTFIRDKRYTNTQGWTNEFHLFNVQSGTFNIICFDLLTLYI